MNHTNWRVNNVEHSSYALDEAASTYDVGLFESNLGPSAIYNGLSEKTLETRRRTREALREQNIEGLEQIREAALKQIATAVVDQKNKMLLESRAGSFKKAAELSKEISF